MVETQLTHLCISKKDATQFMEILVNNLDSLGIYEIISNLGMEYKDWYPLVN